MLGAECGFTPAEVALMSLPEVNRYWSHWRRQPPLRALVGACASALGVNLKPVEPVKPMTPEEAAAFMAMSGGRIPGVGSR